MSKLSKGIRSKKCTVYKGLEEKLEKGVGKYRLKVPINDGTVTNQTEIEMEFEPTNQNTLIQADVSEVSDQESQ